MAIERDEEDPAFRMDHDPEDLVEEGMSAEAAEVDRAETLASTGDAEGSFQEIASGSATGVGIDREEPGAAAIRAESETAAGRSQSPDVDENDGDDSWLQDFPRDLT